MDPQLNKQAVVANTYQPVLGIGSAKYETGQVTQPASSGQFSPQSRYDQFRKKFDSSQQNKISFYNNKKLEQNTKFKQRAMNINKIKTDNNAAKNKVVKRLLLNSQQRLQKF